MPPAQPPKSWRPALFAAAAALLVYAVTLGGTYVYDDRYILLTDPRTSAERWAEYLEEGGRTEFQGSHWRAFWTTDYFFGGADNLYRPIVSMTYALQAKLHGTSDRAAWAFHFVNWLLHAAVSALAAELTRRMTRSLAIATIAGLLFAVHPVHVEAVANIVGRAELMCALGVLAALVLFFRPLTNRRVVAIVGCMLLAILSKEQGLLLPLMLIAGIPLRRQAHADPSAAMRPLSTDAAEHDQHEPLDYARHSTRNARRFSGPPVLLFLLSCWLLAGYIIFRENILKFWWDRSFLDRTINPMIQSAGVDRALMPVVLLGRYVAMLIAPLRLNPDYGGETIGATVSFSDPYLYIGAITIVALALTCVVAVKRRAWVIVFCIACFTLIYGMIGNILTLIGTNFGERLMYLPSVFFCIAAAVLLARLRDRRAMIGVVTAITFLFALRTFTYAARWNDPPRLFSAAIDHHPRAIRLYLLLAEELVRRGDSERAAAALARGREIEPRYYRVWLNSGHLALAMNEPERALQFAREAQKLAPTLEGERLISRAYESLNAATTQPATTEEDFFR